MTETKQEPTQVPSYELKIGDTIEVWWAPRKDRIVNIRPYDGMLDCMKGGFILEFAQNNTGMTAAPKEYFTLLHRAGPQENPEAEPEEKPEFKDLICYHEDTQVIALRRNFLGPKKDKTLEVFEVNTPKGLKEFLKAFTRTAPEDILFDKGNVLLLEF